MVVIIPRAHHRILTCTPYLLLSYLVPEGLCWTTASSEGERTVQRTENSGNEEFCTTKSATIKGEVVEIRIDTIGPSPRRPNPRVSPRTYNKGTSEGMCGGADSLITFPTPLQT